MWKPFSRSHSRHPLERLRLPIALLVGAIAWLVSVVISPDSPPPPARPAEPASRVNVSPEPLGEIALEKGTAKPRQSAKYVLERGFMRVQALPIAERAAATKVLLRELRTYGPAALVEIRAFLRAGYDVALREGYQLTGNRITEASTFRIAVLNALVDWEGAATVMLGVLKTPASLWESIVAIRNLESHYPGTYRTEAVEALSVRIGKPRVTDPSEVHLLAATAHFQATELLPQVEKWVQETPGTRAAGYVQMLDQFPVEVRDPALDRLFTARGVEAALVDTPHALGQMSFADENVGAYLQNVFRRQTAEQRVAMLQNFLPAAPPFPGDLFRAPAEARQQERMAEARAIAEVRGRSKFLQSLEPLTASPEEQAALAEARKAVTAELAARQAIARSPETEPVAETFGFGEGQTVISGRRIESIDLRNEAPVSVNGDSTPDAER